VTESLERPVADAVEELVGAGAPFWMFVRLRSAGRRWSSWWRSWPYVKMVMAEETEGAAPGARGGRLEDMHGVGRKADGWPRGLWFQGVPDRIAHHRDARDQAGCVNPLVESGKTGTGVVG
jgi:hypothetical protein